jgi:hypothetical protein
MIIKVKNMPSTEVTCANCQACCCSLEVMIISDTGVPHQHIHVDEFGSQTMLRLALSTKIGHGFVGSLKWDRMNV